MRIVLILLLAAALAAAQPAPPAAAPAAGGAASPRGVFVPAWPPNGAALTEDSVTASIGGTSAPVLNVQGPDDDLVMLVVLDLAGDLSLVDAARNTMIAEFDEYPNNHYIGVLSAQDGLRVLSEPTANRQQIANAIRSQQVGGRAGLLNTVETAAHLADSIGAKSGVRMAVLYITDSDIENYREDYTNPVVNSSDSRDLSRRFSDNLVKERVSRLVSGLTATQTPVFIVHLDYRTDPLNEAYQTGLLEVARATGGNAWFCRSLSGIPTEVREALDRAESLWSVRVGLPNTDVRQFDVTLAIPSQGLLEYRSRYTISAQP